MMSGLPFSLKDWTKSASHLWSHDDYLLSAVNLALTLTERLTKSLAKIVAGNETASIQDITADNVLIFVSDVFSLSVKDAEFQFEQPSALSLLSEEREPLHPREVCAALGKILLEIFSKGGSSNLKMNEAEANHTDLMNCHNSNNEETIMPPGAKRKVAIPTDNDLSRGGVSSLLLNVGMPQSICQLVRDLLFDSEAEDGQSSESLAMSLDDALWDLAQMKNHPQTYLFDRTCPQKALDDAESTDGQIYGREDQMEALLRAKRNISIHAQMEVENALNFDSISIQNGTMSTNTQRADNRNISYHDNDSVSSQDGNFLCEAVFLSGYAGSGKSVLLTSLIHDCNEEQWFVLGCKFDKQAAPHMIIAKAFDHFFEKWGPNHNAQGSRNMMDSFQAICRSIFSAVDNDGFNQLCELIPNFAMIFPLLAQGTNRPSGISSMDKVGSAKTRLQNLFNVLLKSLTTAGRPVLFTFDDLQWSGSMMETVTTFVENYSTSSIGKEMTRGGMLIAGTYRSNEVKESDDLVSILNTFDHSKKANVTMLTVGPLSEIDVTRLISAKLCLPMRYTQELAQLVHLKTRGNPFFCIQFLRTIIHNTMLEFSVRSRRWVWDIDTLDMQMISDGVAELLTTTFNRLPSPLMKTVKIVSCLGSQVEMSTVEALNLGQGILPFDMLEQLDLAVKEGLMEKAGPVYQFTHDIINQTIRELLPAEIRNQLHKTIGKSLLRSAADNHEIHLLAVDQINIYCEGFFYSTSFFTSKVEDLNHIDPNHHISSGLNPQERSLFAEINATAAKYSIAASSFDQARSYIDMGMKLLETEHWETQYSLSMVLYEMSASVSFMNGDISRMSKCLEETLLHSKTLEDRLNASALYTKLMEQKGNFDEAISCCLSILSHLGEEFSQEVSLPDALNELVVMSPLLRTITGEQIKSLPKMADTNTNKMNAMKFLSMSCTYCVISKPVLLPLLACRMVNITMAQGFCEESIIGLAQCAYSVFLFNNDIELGYRVGKVCEMLISESPKRHALRSRLCIELENSMRCLVEPLLSVIATYPSLYDSAMLVGDIDCAMKLGWLYCNANFYMATAELTSLAKDFVSCIKQQTKYQQSTTLYLTMAAFGSTICLTGKCFDGVLSYDDLRVIGQNTNNHLLVWQVLMSSLCAKFWMKDYLGVVQLLESQQPSQQKRVLEYLRCFFEGIACLSLARDTHQQKYKHTGEESVKKIEKVARIGEWNFRNKAHLLKAELYYLDGDLKSADDSFKSSIASASKHKWFNEEALAYELYGTFCVENKLGLKGYELLRTALDKYKEWGAIKKVEELQLFIDLIDPTYWKDLSERWHLSSSQTRVSSKRMK